MMKLPTDCAYSLLVPTSMGVRLTPDNGQPFHCSSKFMIQVTSAESNVASVASYLGLPVKVLTTFVKGSPISRMIKDDLAGRHMDYEGPEVEQGDPWGYRHQFNLADSGTGSRGLRFLRSLQGRARGASAHDAVPVGLAGIRPHEGPARGDDRKVPAHTRGTRQGLRRRRASQEVGDWNVN